MTGIGPLYLAVGVFAVRKGGCWPRVLDDWKVVNEWVWLESAHEGCKGTCVWFSVNASNWLGIRSIVTFKEADLKTRS